MIGKLGRIALAPAQIRTLFAATAVFLIAFAVYLPYFKNPFIFDDFSLFGDGSFHVAALTPWQIGLRGLPYFTLAFVETVFGQIWVHRLLSYVLHASCALLIFLFVRDLLRDASKGDACSTNSARPYWPALIAALAFAAHPVAVYGAGYLIQRSILLATLFSLLCLRAFRHGLISGSRSAILSAAVLYVLAVLSKEHALLLPFAAAPLGVLIARTHGIVTTRRVAAFLALCVPIVLLVLLQKTEFIAASYEPFLEQLQGERFGAPAHASRFDSWLASASMQALLFFKYALLWFWPDTSQMAIDLRVDFGGLPSDGSVWLSLSIFAAVGLAALAALVFGGHSAATAACAVLYAWVMFLIEMGAVRFQEPFVLYRSYLWAPAYAILFALLLQRVRVRLAIGFAVVVLPILAIGAHDRLATFQSELALWNDAVAALPRADIVGARRIYFLRGSALYRLGRYAEALRDAEMAVRLAPGNGRMLIARGATLLQLGHLPEAARDFEAATRLAPGERRAHLFLALALERLGNSGGADRAVAAAEVLGHRDLIDWLRKFREQKADKHSAGNFPAHQNPSIR